MFESTITKPPGEKAVTLLPKAHRGSAYTSEVSTRFLGGSNLTVFGKPGGFP